MKTIYEDNEILVIDKPCGVVVNRSDTHKGTTVQDFVAEELDFEPEVDDETDFSGRSGIVHRLDKDTSGVLLIAKTKDAFLDLQRQFKERVVTKVYLAVVMGKVTWDRFEVNAPIGRSPRNRMLMAVVKDGKEAKTTFEFLSTFEKEGVAFSLVKAFPSTGRTHQIRVHLSALNHQVVGDQTYCTRAMLRQSEKAFARMMLHALSISFTHPATGERVKYTTEIPLEFKDFVHAQMLA